MFGERLKFLRLQREWSQQKLADLSDVSQKAISQWENNERMPTWDAVLRLARALEVPLESFGTADDLDKEES
jgi:transcriptional regulator with XRE-family HTH domain